MLFSLLKGYAKLALQVYCRSIVINKPDWLNTKGPLLLACNHPNSFLDGMILTTLFRHPVYSLARGDAFRTRWHNTVLRWLHLLPVYRTSEGVENLEYNYTTFDACKEVFRQDGIVIIFSEGQCINEWHLRPLKKGTARLAAGSWEAGINLTVLTVGLNYNSFRNFGKNVWINFGQPIDSNAVMQHRTDGKMFLTFNDHLESELQKLVFEIDTADRGSQKRLLTVPIPAWKKGLLALPALAGFLLHAPLYFATKAITSYYFDNDHFDSVVAGVLVLAYPVYLLIISVIVGYEAGLQFALIIAVLLPFCAWSCVQLKPQL